ncbi:hypothetical protein [Reichenbachiella ulvae]|uniref:Uncharacterized protein n=1 Tax=Reichenbachiella ulvae TaxID=2980104 RepID=A0ABT3CXT7_9BACT|nr:hypothetical protein [Reichenbachiella ulvae]MCV9388457.1 hypothetical protein [Reichenbachiella ulvae]
MTKSLILTLLFAVLLSQPLLAQFNENYREPKDPMKEHTLRKVAQYSKLKRTGFTLLGGGILATTVGVALIAGSDWQKDINGTWYTEDDEAVWGTLGVLYVGIPLIAGGTTLSIIGSVKEKKYLQRLDNLNAYYMNHNGAHGIRLVYNF